MKEIKAFQCDYCNKYYKHKSSAKRHENRCFKNPKNKACLSCGNFKTDYETVYVRPYEGHNYGDDDYDVKYNYCDYTEKSFAAAIIGENENRQEFQRNCKHWISIVVEDEEEEEYI